MPNQLNFPDPITSTTLQRPSRIALADLRLIRTGEKTVLFGTHAKDVVELWVYNADGSIEGHLTLDVTSPLLTLNTIVDTSGATEVLQIDMVDASNQMGLQPGRYAIVANIFRDEVGSENGYKLYISEISKDRTELRLRLSTPTEEQLRDVYEFVAPSAPKLYVQGLVDQGFGKVTDAPNATVITLPKILVKLEAILSGVSTRITNANLDQLAATIVDTILQRTRKAVHTLLVNDVRNLNIQQVELEEYIFTALDATLYDMQQRGEIPPYFRLI